MGVPAVVSRTQFDELYRAHGEAVRLFVRSRVGGTEVDDICQEVWAAVARALAQQTAIPTRPWIFAIARHKTIDAWRRDAGIETLDSQLADGGPLATLLGLRPITTPSRRLARRRRALALRAALANLRAEDRELLELRFVLDLKPAEIAVVLGADAPKPNTIAQRIVRATQQLRAVLIAAGVDPPTR